MQIFKVEIEWAELHRDIQTYIINHNYQTPVVLMNQETVSYLKSESTVFLNEDRKIKDTDIPTVFGCNIAIANWLLYGEVELR